MKKILALFIVVSTLCFIGLSVYIANSAPSRLSTTAINEAVMYSIYAIEEADHARALDILLGGITQEFEQVHQSGQRRNINILLAVGVYQAFFVAVFLILHMYYKKRIIDPFVRLKDFAKNVARGDLDTPIKMDKHSTLGAFTESFDILREELKTARENEREATLRKKELVATISHDLKTPVAAIKATIELMQIRDHDEKTKYQLQEMFNKAEEITVLVNDMFHSTLQELEALKVSITEFPSTTLAQLIQSADYKKMTNQVQIPDCVLLSDTVRLGQVFDNIIGNSYKYANTKIEVAANFDGQSLIITFRDFGKGVDNEELPLLFGKFYRGKNTTNINGYGLGLYIAKHLLQEMGGNIHLSNANQGLITQVILPLA
ncbi:MAG: HAMP domain-containing histidine kinase [Defluviitaleaceae bacterium]|nr:HAMP domain-containing histidine kinase [Defluviitaleaceae bacterium]